jgi:thiamine kinase-like enzyme
MGCILRAYARLHVMGRDCLPPAQDRAWLYQMALQRRPWRLEELLAKVEALIERGIWAPIAGIGRLVETTLAGIAGFSGTPATLLHNDVYPPNIALPHNLAEEAVLVDWEMVGVGPAQLDTAFMFLLPYRNTRNINRAEALEDYWQQRFRLEGVIPPAGEREEMQRYADAFWVLSLVPVAARVAAQPFAPGSAPATYWEAMFGVLEEQLRALSQLTQIRPSNES